MYSSYKKLPASWIIYKVWNISKGTFYLFVFFKMLSIILNISINFLVAFLIIYFLFSLISCFLQWINFKYTIYNGKMFIQKGALFKQEKTFNKNQIQNITIISPFLHRLFKRYSINITLTSIGDNSNIKMEMLSFDEVKKIQKKLDIYDIDNDMTISNNNTIFRYQPNLSEIFIGSLTIVKFLIFVSFIYSFFDKVKEFLGIDAFRYFKNIISSNFNNIYMILLTIFIYILFNIVTNILLYGNYIVTGREDYISMSKGIIDKDSFTLSKDKVKGLSIQYSLLQKVLGICKVKIVFTESSDDPNSRKLNILFPFIKIKNVDNTINLLLPSYSSYHDLKKLPFVSIIANFYNCKWFIIILLLLLVNDVLGLSLFYKILLIFIGAIQIFKTYTNSYYFGKDKVQIKKLIINITIYTTHINNIEEVLLKQNYVQKRLNLCSIIIVNQGSPYIRNCIDNIPTKDAGKLIEYYQLQYKNI